MEPLEPYYPSHPVSPVSPVSPCVTESVDKKLHEINTVLPPGVQCPLPHCAGSPMDMPSPTYVSECEQCVTECDLENCDLATEEQCTDRCVVVPCDDPCLDICGTCASWPNHICEGGQCQGEELLGYLPHPGSTHSSFPSHTHPQDHNHAYHPDWNNASLSRELDALICACTTQLFPHSFDCNSCDPKLLSINKPHTHSHHELAPPSTPAPASIPSSPASALLSPMLSSSNSSRSSPDPMTITSASQPSGRVATPETNAQTNEHGPSEAVSCLWAGCRKLFKSFHDLISHVNTAHLYLPITQESVNSPQQVSLYRQSPLPTYVNAHGNATLPDLNAISCMWGNCNLYPTPFHVPGPSTGNATDAAMGFLASHLLQDHLGIPVPCPSTPTNRDGETRNITLHGDQTPLEASRPVSHFAFNAPAFIFNSRSSPSPAQPTATNAGSESVQPAPQRFCKWQSCPQAQVAFASAAELTSHIADVHVGAGNSRYHCMWEDCNRHGEAGFSSKQKILRHIQSHTGHRPFQCKICEQYFSEVATLQQHMRRHTKEKPYICDFPGCNKAFAITGALTIHRRVHSGSKPFKCTYCDRSFSESSNLSKHIRTHTGDRPYACFHPGCEKRFARPDQVARHMNVHNKKKKAHHPGEAEEIRRLQVDGMDVHRMKIEA